MKSNAISRAKAEVAAPKLTVFPDLAMLESRLQSLLMLRLMVSCLLVTLALEKNGARG